MVFADCGMSSSTSLEPCKGDDTACARRPLEAFPCRHLPQVGGRVGASPISELDPFDFLSLLQFPEERATIPHSRNDRAPPVEPDQWPAHVGGLCRPLCTKEEK